MSDGDSLYRAILAQPLDDAPRLVYADWLEENGRAEEAEFIRLDCRLEASAPDAPGYVEDRDRLRNLRLWLQTHCPGPSFRRLPADLRLEDAETWWESTHRGFPAHISLRQGRDRGQRMGVKGVRKAAAALEKLYTKLPARWLVLNHIAVEDLVEFLKQPAVAGIERLTVSLDEPAGDEAARVLAACAHLRNLRAAFLNFPLGEAGAEALGRSEHFGSIECLDLSTEFLSPAAISYLGKATWFQNLRALSLGHGLGEQAFLELCRASPFSRLHTLDLSGAGYPPTNWQEFARSRSFPRLCRLDLQNGDMSDGQMAALAAAGLRLTWLDLGACSIGDDGVRSIADAAWAESLRILHLGSNQISPSGLAALTSCHKLASLQELDLSGNYLIDGPALVALAQSPTLANLVSLAFDGFSQEPFPDPVLLQEFLQTLNMPKLRALGLSMLRIGDRAAGCLSDQKFQSLTHLNLNNGELNDDVVSKLLVAPSLQNLMVLSLEGNNIKTGVEPLLDRRTLPQLATCLLAQNPIPPDLCRKLARRPGVIVPEQTEA